MYEKILDNPDPDGLMTLPTPRKIWSKMPSVANLYKYADLFYKLWLSLLSGDFGFDEAQSVVRYNCGRCIKTHEYSRDAGMQRLLMIVGSAYAFCAHQLVTANETFGSDDLGIPGCSAESLGKLRTEKGSTCLEWSRELLSQFVGVLQAARCLYLIRRNLLPSEMWTDAYEQILADSVLDVYHVLDKSTTAEGVCRLGMEAAMLMRRVTAYSLHLQSSVYRWPARPWSETHTSGPFSLLRLPELQLLASQDEQMSRRYGAKAVEKTFESQLALLTQSLGFYVIKTRTGERTVDLVCVSGDPSASFTMMIEAKTTKAAYSLPTKDERALVEYVSTVQEGLTTSPNLALVLVVGSAASKTLDGRLRRVEVATGVPTRFCTAQQLATLRESILGPLPLSLFKKQILDASRVVPTENIQAIVQSVNARSAAQEALVRAFLER
jgi:hypothetical protein